MVISEDGHVPHQPPRVRALRSPRWGRHGVTVASSDSIAVTALPWQQVADGSEERTRKALKPDFLTFVFTPRARVATRKPRL